MPGQISQHHPSAKIAETLPPASVDPGSSEAPEIRSPQAELGHSYLAREIYEHILSTQPDHPESLQQLGLLHLEQGECEQAIEKLKKSCDLQPEDAACHDRLGVALATGGDAVAAERAHRRALEIDPDNAEAHFNLGLALEKQSKLDEAITSYKRALQLDQNHGRAFNKLGNTFERQGDLDGALVCYQEALIKEAVTSAFGIGMLQNRDEIEALARFIVRVNPRHVMEIGSHRGGTLYLWSKLIRGGGKKIAVDLPSGPFGGISESEVERRNAATAEWAEDVILINGNSHDVQTFNKVRVALGDDKLDFLFIDGDHTYEGIKLDYFMYKDFVRKGGYIAFHDIKDTELHRSQNCNVARFWRELTIDNDDKMEIISETQWGGIGVIAC